METLFWLEPFAKFLNIGGVTAGVCCLITALVIWGISVTDKDFKHMSAAVKKITKAGVIVLIIAALSTPFADAFNIYKKTLIYRGIESETADKLINNVNSLLDLTSAKIKEFTPTEKK